ncbi:MAG: winged helix-turn-helix transcriptional regulator [Planctomycetes bacterium]|nr:winged helix-turn-helix transcriptional regulator [Planctomycetota bacterium]
MADEQEFLADIAYMYYTERLNQSQIADRLGISRSMISRYLDKALRAGVVEIIIHHPANRDHRLEQAMRKMFGVEDIRVGAAQDQEGGDRTGFFETCGLAAKYLLSLIDDDTTIAVAWGRAVASVVNAIRPTRRYPGATVVQPFGSALPNQALDGTAIIGELAAKLGGRAVYLHVPLHVGNEQTRNMLLNDRQIKSVIRTAGKADFIITCIGCAGGSTGTGGEYSWNNYLTKRRLESLLRRGSVGHIFTRHFDIDGTLLDMEEYNGIIGLSHAEYMKIPLRIGVAIGAEKAPSIVGALRGGYINSLITDAAAAQAVVAATD